MTFLRNVRIADGSDPRVTRKVDIELDGANIAAITDATGQVAEGDIDGRGLFAIPGVVNTHAHVDKSWWGRDWQSYGGENTLDGRIQHERARRGELGIPGVDVTSQVLEQFVLHGTTAMRSHVDVDPGIGLTGLEVVREAVAKVAPDMLFELVAFPQDGVLRRDGVDELLRAAAREGLAEHIGGLDPAGIDRDPVGQLDLLFEIAEETGCGIDIHLHDGESLGGFQFELILDRVEALDLKGKVTIAHGLALGGLPARQQESIIARMAEGDVSLTTVAPAYVAPLPRRLLREAGVRVGFGTDGIRDLWSPYGDGDTLRIALNYARMSGARYDEELVEVLDWATGAAHTFVGGQPTGIKPGERADIVLLDAENPMDALVRAPRREMVLLAGKLAYSLR
ncbi:amidohydrolase family protein [Dermabacteraceae bacterium CCM 9519]